MSDPSHRANHLLSGLSWKRYQQAKAGGITRKRQVGWKAQSQQKPESEARLIYKRGKTYWYNFRWTVRNPDETNESFRIVKSAKTQNKGDAKDVEDEHRRALRLGEIHPRDPWPKVTATAPPVFRSFSKEFLQYAKTHTKPGTHRFYESCLERLLALATIADAPLNAITGELASRYARHRQEVANNSVVTVNGDLRTLRRILKLAIDWGRLDHA